ncbi:junction-mediating and -regulatory protein [Biomphalaria glabrata]|uniref:Uncharacterized protein n=1 Tax=Biomphalaria glabrata TaxID=6526 RepID=A0A2C9KQB4_BIOGL|nr:junction-mediating and -regulatory protein-like [Biomphalaria glabrata]KAI8793220.1 junction-mediating and -regulatory protein [Biomphalaria glabrata]
MGEYNAITTDKLVDNCEQELDVVDVPGDKPADKVDVNPADNPEVQTDSLTSEKPLESKAEGDVEKSDGTVCEEANKEVEQVTTATPEMKSTKPAKSEEKCVFRERYIPVPVLEEYVRPPCTVAYPPCKRPPTPPPPPRPPTPVPDPDMPLSPCPLPYKAVSDCCQK